MYVYTPAGPGEPGQEGWQEGLSCYTLWYHIIV